MNITLSELLSALYVVLTFGILCYYVTDGILAKRRRRLHYNNLLKASIYELSDQQNFTETEILKELAMDTSISSHLKKVVPERCTFQYRTDFLEQVRLEILKFNYSNEEVIRTLGAYIERCKNINTNLDYNKIKDYQDSFSNADTFTASFIDYTKSLKERISMLQSLRFNLINSLTKK